MIQNTLHSDEILNYQLLGRLKMDCEYYLGFGHKNVRRLWAGSVEAQITEMKNLYNSFSENQKPQWLTWEEILTYEALMCGEVHG